jgi:hypothetical protein
MLRAAERQEREREYIIKKAEAARTASGRERETADKNSLSGNTNNTQVFLQIPPRYLRSRRKKSQTQLTISRVQTRREMIRVANFSQTKFCPLLCTNLKYMPKLNLPKTKLTLGQNK